MRCIHHLYLLASLLQPRYNDLEEARLKYRPAIYKFVTKLGLLDIIRCTLTTLELTPADFGSGTMCVDGGRSFCRSL